MNLNFDLKSVAGISAVAMFFLSAIKTLFPKLVKDREPIIAVVIGLALSIAAHVSRTIAFKPGLEGWLEAIGTGLVVAIGAGAGHDYAMNPVKELFSSTWSKVIGFFKKKDGGGDEKSS